MKKLLILILFMFYSCNKSSDNLENIKKVRIGMKMSEVNKIMKNYPINYVYRYEGDSLVKKLYKSPVGSAGDFEIVYCKKDSTVLRINYGD